MKDKSDKENKRSYAIAERSATWLRLPVHIECFDNSNFQGSYPVSAMVYFKNGIPGKADYRKFNIKTVTGINDFATMKEVVYRRYKRLLKKKTALAPTNNY